MSRTVAEAQAAYRKRRAAKVARYEAALREIADPAHDGWAAELARDALGDDPRHRR